MSASRSHNIYGNIEPYTQEQNYEIARRIKAGEEHLKADMIEHNLPLATYFAYRLTCMYKNYDYDSIVSDATLGLMKAVDKYDPDLDCTFSTYAYYWVTSYVQRGYWKHVGVPFLKSAQYRTYVKYLEEYLEKAGCYPSIDEIKEELGIGEQLICKFENYYNRKSTDMLVGKTVDDINDDQLVYDTLLNTLFVGFDTHLNEKEAEVMKLFVQGVPQVDIAKRMNLSRERIRQIKNKSMRKLERKGFDMRKIIEGDL